tara:strand:+ start:990 stop:1757 length:768 start_codon:yes stop_codon:yes gene_type:complete
MKNIKKKNPKFSVITVVKNDKLKISSTIKSVLNQTYKNFEYIVVDGKSTDGTLKILSKFKKKINSLISESDKGIYFAMNKGIKISKGEIIIFINSGDLFSKNAFRIINNVFQSNKKIDFVFGTINRHYTKSTILKHGINSNRLKYNFDFATAHSTGFFLKRKIFSKYGLFNTKYKCSADYDLYYRLILKNKVFGSSTKKNQLIGIVKSGGYSSKISFFDHLIEETKIRLDNKQNFFLVFLIFINAIFKNFIKNFF